MVKFFFAVFHRGSLRNKIFIMSRLTVIIRPSVYSWQFTWPVTVDMLNWRSRMSLPVSELTVILSKC